ncbi:MAG: hypothetical protein K8L99_04765 [Anaerolineae bacterium]|nr:hypothetical protein [Anaerolineae bacterium]
MLSDVSAAPTPDLRIVPVNVLYPHEDHDSQRSEPLIERLKTESLMINPPIVAPMSNSEFVILDGANRCYAFQQLNYPHILVQVAPYDSGYVQLETWSHVVSHWQTGKLLDHLRALPDLTLSEGYHASAIAQFTLRDNSVLSVLTPFNITKERNAVLREVVSVYQKNASLHRTAIREPDDIWPLFEECVALVIFPSYQPADIITAARHHAYLPPGVSRHIVHGRALRVNYPMDRLRDENTPLQDKNQALQSWVREKLGKRKVRYYAEATYQFDE